MVKKIDLTNRSEAIQRLQTEFSDNGHIYKLNLRNEHVAIYEQYDKNTGYLVGYELIKINIREAEVIKGKEYKRRETYPSTASWGLDGFTLRKDCTQEYLEKRFKEFNDEIINRSTNSRTLTV